VWFPPCFPAGAAERPFVVQVMAVFGGGRPW
jgi:hypothetical protein